MPRNTGYFTRRVSSISDDTTPERWCLVPHDTLIEIVRAHVGDTGEEIKWSSVGDYHTIRTSGKVLELIEPYSLVSLQLGHPRTP